MSNRQADARLVALNVLPFPDIVVQGGRKVQPINQFLIFEFGAKVRAVSLLPDEPTLGQAAGALFPLQSTLEALSQGKPIMLDLFDWRDPRGVCRGLGRDPCRIL